MASARLPACLRNQAGALSAVMRHGISGTHPEPLVAILIGLCLSACRAAQGQATTAFIAPEPLSLASTEAPVPSVASTPQLVACINEAQFIEDLTILDGSRVQPGELMDKRWSVLNSGTCDWGPGYRLTRTDDGSLETSQELALYPARAGEQAVWQVLLIAPRVPGQYLASWQARSPSGEPFGDQVFVLFEVATAGP